MQKQLIAVLLAGGIAFAAQAADFPKEINITYVKAPFNLQNIVMKEQGLLEKAFEKDGVKVNWRVINSGADQSLAMASGALDFSAVMNTASLLLGAGAGNPIAIATGVAHPEKIFAMVGKPGSNLTVKDLKGKTVGGPKGTVLHQMLVAALTKEGMTINDVNFVNMDPGAAMTAVVAGKIDAGLVAANGIIKANAAGAKTITTCEGLVEPNLVMTVRKSFASEYPEAYARVIEVHRNTWKWIQENKAEALAMGAKEQGITLDEATKLYEWSNFYDVLDEGDVKGLEKDMKFLIDNGMMKKSLDVRSLVLPSAMK